MVDVYMNVNYVMNMLLSLQCENMGEALWIDGLMLSRGCACVLCRTKQDEELRLVEFVLENLWLSTFSGYQFLQLLTMVTVHSSNWKYHVLYLKEKHLLQDEKKLLSINNMFIWVELMNFGYVDEIDWILLTVMRTDMKLMRHAGCECLRHIAPAVS